VISAVALEQVQVGDAIPTISKVVRREDVKAYADASGDQNPLHQDDAFARSVGFPGIIAHGMFTMAHVVKAVTDWIGDPGALRSVDVQFRAFMADPFATIRTIYEHLGLELEPEAEQRMRDFLDANPQDKHGVHTYSFGETGLDEGALRERARRYQEYFDVPSESLG